ncbi:TlpA disulfide reductase family protein [Saccharopolyspora phatthalungensis]|uniref:Thiol-disulfide isomerase/thioredoxin n=1 Tax=Saccharopolyspora phatthalungensis TaxID=664693 RepID=A0A840Q7G4_9PSEU|nr:TlpA disulfide reductase family protein [Saccharopolyspora phatthalungensis]MBB5154648.1 thiol-disulfide isomerase/thioredoxin [Saccharopolyspora phatthalungensis]
MKRLLVRFGLVAAALALVGGCATQGDDANSQGGGEFTFVSPGGQTRLFYPQNERGRVSGLAGESLLEPGKQIGLDDFKGQVVVLNIWGSWCGPCRSEADDLQAVQDKTKSQGVQVLGIDVRDDRSAAADFDRDRRLTYPSIFDPAGRSLLALRQFPRATVPATIVLDRQHRVAAIFLTEMLESELLPEVQKVAAEPR